jgi:hypothetical protein
VWAGGLLVDRSYATLTKLRHHSYAIVTNLSQYIETLDHALPLLFGFNSVDLLPPRDKHQGTLTKEKLI